MIWRPKPETKYIPIDYNNNIEERVFNYSHHGNTVYCPKEKWSNKPRDDVISFNSVADMEDLMTNLKIRTNIKREYKDSIIDIIKKYWDCFCAKGACRPILDYEFIIDTCASKPVCCC